MMNVSKLLIASGLLTSVAAITGEAQAPTSVPVEQLHRTVSRDPETRIARFGFWTVDKNSACTAYYIPKLELVAAPAHGTVRFVTASFTPARSGCNNSIYGTRVVYRPNPGFVGQDQFTFNLPPDPMLTNWTGPGPGSYVITVEVR
jgi:hypothetical protein